MSEAKNIFAILDELKGNAKQIDNEGLESVEKLITEAKRIFVGGAVLFSGKLFFLIFCILPL